MSWPEGPTLSIGVRPLPVPARSTQECVSHDVQPLMATRLLRYPDPGRVAMRVAGIMLSWCVRNRRGEVHRGHSPGEKGTWREIERGRQSKRERERERAIETGIQYREKTNQLLSQFPPCSFPSCACSIPRMCPHLRPMALPAAAREARVARGCTQIN